MSEEVAVVEPGGALAIPDEDNVGLEDITSDDLIMPTIKIEHTKGVFVDGLTSEEFPKITCVMLGLIKGRVLWEAEVPEGKSDGPLCKSYNFQIGLPDADRFPWKESGFDKTTDAGSALACADCKLKDWGSHPKNDTPWCSEQHTFAILLPTGEDGDLLPALLTVQRSAIKPSKTYLTSFARSKTPLYTVWTQIELDARKRGTVDFAVPKFIKKDPTEQADWSFFAQQYRNIRTFVQTPRGEEEEAVTVIPSGTPASAPPEDTPATAAPVASSTPASAATPTSTPPPAAEADDEDDLPF